MPVVRTVFRPADQFGQTLEEARRRRANDTRRGQIEVSRPIAEGGRILFRGDSQLHGKDHFPEAGDTLFPWIVGPRRGRVQERQAAAPVGGEKRRFFLLQRQGQSELEVEQHREQTRERPGGATGSQFASPVTWKQHLSQGIVIVRSMNDFPRVTVKQRDRCASSSTSFL